MTRLPRSVLRRFGKDESGVISVLGAMMLLLALAIAMIVVDTGALLYAKREQQAATDAAALGAVRQLDNPQAAAEAIFGLNDYATTNVQARGIYYVSDASRAPAARYFEIGETASDGTVVDADNINAVRVRQLTDSPTYLARLFGFGNMTDIETVAIATLSKHVSFSAGTGLVDIDLAKQLLGDLLGVSLNAINYEAIASTDVAALEFLDALAIRKGLDVGGKTYADLLSENVSVGDIFGAALDVLNESDADGYNAVSDLDFHLGPVKGVTIALNQLLDATPFVNRVIGSVESLPGTEIPFNVANLLSGTAIILGDGKAVNFNKAVNVGSLVSVSGTVRVGAPMARMAVGKIGDSVHTSQVDVQLLARISLGIPLVLTTEINLPIFVRAAAGIAKVESIPCVDGGTMVTLSRATDAGIARIGTGENGPPANISLRLLFIPLVDLPISGNVSIASSGPENVNFSKAMYDTKVTGASSVNVFSQLRDALVVGNPGGLTSQILTGLTSTISNVLSLLDPILDDLLGALGVKLGTIDMFVHGAKCNAPALVG